MILLPKKAKLEPQFGDNHVSKEVPVKLIVLIPETCTTDVRLFVTSYMNSGR
jgi:hypothetical protein